MRLTWERIKRSLGIPDKTTDAEAADELTGREAFRLTAAGPQGIGRPKRDGRRGGALDSVGAPDFVEMSDSEGPSDPRGRRKSEGPPDQGGPPGPEFTGRGQPQIESGPWGALPNQDGPRRYAGFHEAVTDNGLSSAGGDKGGPERDDGVAVRPTPITLGETVHVTYRGPLAQRSATPVHLHWGFGPGPWREGGDEVMHRRGDGYTAALQVETKGSFEFCFHDNEGNWDNNDGRNWSYTVHDGRPDEPSAFEQR